LDVSVSVSEVILDDVDVGIPEVGVEQRSASIELDVAFEVMICELLIKILGEFLPVDPLLVVWIVSLEDEIDLALFMFGVLELSNKSLVNVYISGLHLVIIKLAEEGNFIDSLSLSGRGLEFSISAWVDCSWSFSDLESEHLCKRVDDGAINVSVDNSGWNPDGSVVGLEHDLSFSELS
jgi:hypothetical protein